ncbi:hypothetical protein ACPW96_21550 [Micromonospora sp. DT81.3]|uniref:hypothetical protein n=1 Tax=Micromonospora sp. DT81.3 TaxID=3416523 RepID=UPI003CE702DA
MTTTLTSTEYRTIQRSLELAASYAGTETEESRILGLIGRLRQLQRAMPVTADHETVLATIAAVKATADKEPLTPQVLDRLARELTQESAETPSSAITDQR